MLSLLQIISSFFPPLPKNPRYGVFYNVSTEHTAKRPANSLVQKLWIAYISEPPSYTDKVVLFVCMFVFASP